MVPASTGCLSQRQQGYVGQLGTAQHGSRWRWSLVERRGAPATVLMPSCTPSSSSLGLLPAADTILCCVPPACPFLEQTGSCTSTLALTSMPALLWMLSTSPASSQAKEPKASQEQPHHCPAQETLSTVSCSTQGYISP